MVIWQCACTKLNTFHGGMILCVTVMLYLYRFIRERLFCVSAWLYLVIDDIYSNIWWLFFFLLSVQLHAESDKNKAQGYLKLL